MASYHAPLRNPFNDPIDYPEEPTIHTDYPPPSSIPSSSNPAIHVRTPSPTPSEAKELQSGAIDWKAMKSWRFWIRKEWRWYYVIVVIILVITALVSIFHTQIVHWLTPVTRWMYKLKFGWLVPIAVLFVISFPPLFGHEIVAILCGLVWGLWVGFAIVAAGTFLGEIGNFYAFKACCRSRGEKLEKTKISYACLAKVVRDGGFKIALIARLSAIPGHFTTAVFSTCGMGIIVFALATILSLPKQFITVYLGVILEESGTGTTATKSRIITDVVLAITFLVTVLAMWYIFHEMNKVKPDVIYQRRRARIGKMKSDGASLALVSSIDSDSIPLTTPDTPYQNWDRRGAMPNGSDAELFAPVPERATDHSQGYQIIHGLGRPHDEEEEIEWDTSSSPYGGIVEPADGKGIIGNSLSARSSTTTVYAPVPSRPSKPGEVLSRLQTQHSTNVPDVLQTPTQGTYPVSHSQDSDHVDPGPDAHTYREDLTNSHAKPPSQDLTDLSYRGASGGFGPSNDHRISTSPPPPSYHS